MEQLKQAVQKWIDENKEEFYTASDALWEYPELGMEEYKASGLLTALLRKHGFEVETGVADMPTAFVGRAGHGRPVIGFSAEFDALPGLSQRKDCETKAPVADGAPGQGCGHNLMGIGGIMAAAALKAVLEENGLAGTIKVFGTPAEELCIGKPFMARAGLFDDLDLVLDWHSMVYNRAGFTDCPAYFNVKYHFSGSTAHGNAPWNGRSALDAALLTGQALEMLREHLRPGKPEAETTLNYSFPDVGTGFPNVVPDKTTMWVIGRVLNAEQMADMTERADNCAKGAALATGTTVEKEVVTVTHEKIPNETLSHVMYNNFQLVGTPQWDEEDQRVAKGLQHTFGVPEDGLGKPIDAVEFRGMSVTDSSEYSWFAPTEVLMVELAPTGVGWHNWAVARCAGGGIGKKTVAVASKVLGCTAIEMIKRPELIEKAKAELEQRLAGRVYRPLFEDSIKPACNINREAMAKYKK